MRGVLEMRIYGQSQRQVGTTSSSIIVLNTEYVIREFDIYTTSAIHTLNS
jgi:hypothetical protein